jgi:hypothetical protein
VPTAAKYTENSIIMLAAVCWCGTRSVAPEEEQRVFQNVVLRKILGDERWKIV